MRDNFKWVNPGERVLAQRMSVIQLGQHLALNEQICKTVYGNGSLCHRDAVLARMMYEQIMKYLSEKEINDATFKDVHKEILCTLADERDEINAGIQSWNEKFGTSESEIPTEEDYPNIRDLIDMDIDDEDDEEFEW